MKAKITEKHSEWGPEMEVTQDMINRFAELTGDRQWIHVDVERAKKESPFGGPIAHGFLTLSLLPAIRARTDYRWSARATRSITARTSCAFSPRSRRAPSCMRARRLVNVEGKPKGTLITNEIEVGVVGQTVPALIYEMMVLYHPAMKRG